MKGTCENCRWFKPDGSYTTHGTCHYNPPIIINDTLGTKSEWPFVGTDDFCSHCNDRIGEDKEDA